MKKSQFRFKIQLFSINGVYNIPGLIICSSHGYAYKTLCCKECGELFVLDLEYPHQTKSDLSSLLKGQSCPKCNANLENTLVDYPENIFHDGRILKNSEAINRTHFEETNIIEAYLLN